MRARLLVPAAAVLTLAVAAATPLAAGPRQVGRPGDWAGTVAGAVVGNTLYTVERSGALYATTPVTGTWKKVGKSDFAGTALAVAVGDGLYTIERDGSLYAVSTFAGTWRRLGAAGDWKGTVAAAGLGGRLYTVESSGRLYATDPASGRWEGLGRANFAATRFLLGDGASLYTIEADGTLYAVSPRDGSWKPLGRPGALRDTVAAAAASGRLFTVDSAGALRVSDLGSGMPGTPSPGARVRFLFATGAGLFGIDEGGSLLALEAGGAAPPAPAAVAPAPAVPVASPARAMLGRWVGDPDALQRDPSMKAVGTGNPEMLKGLVGMLASVRIEFTPKTMTIEIMGDTSPPLAYKVLGTSGNAVTIENLEGEKKGSRGRVEFVDPTHLKFWEEGKESSTMFLRRE